MDRREIEEMLHRQRVMVLSTYGRAEEGGQAFNWAAPVYYAHDWTKDGLRLYFQSSPRSIHAVHQRQQPLQAAAVFEDNPDWRLIKGLQFTGQVAPIEESELGAVKHRYLNKFPWAAPLLERASSGMSRSSGVVWYSFQVVELYQVDNRQGFGRRRVEF